MAETVHGAGAHEHHEELGFWRKYVFSTSWPTPANRCR
jgi:hypothetical protein